MADETGPTCWAGIHPPTYLRMGTCILHAFREVLSPWWPEITNKPLGVIFLA